MINMLFFIIMSSLLFLLNNGTKHDDSLDIMNKLRISLFRQNGMDKIQCAHKIICELINDLTQIKLFDTAHDLNQTECITNRLLSLTNDEFLNKYPPKLFDIERR